MADEICMKAFCESCEEMQEVEPMGEEEGDRNVMCLVCGEEFEMIDPEAEKRKHFVAGCVLSVEPLKKMKKVIVDIGGGETSSKQIVTNAKHIGEGWRVIVALENAIVPLGADLEENPNAFRVKKTSVGGVKSEGMLCDCPMLSWSGGAKGIVQQLDASFEVGGLPPLERPRGK